MNSTKELKTDHTWPRQIATPAQALDALRQRTKLCLIKSPVCSKIVLQIVGSWAYLTAHVFNKSRVFNIKVFNQEIKRIETQTLNDTQTTDARGGKSPLLTLSNHISCIDDPVLWASLLPLTYYSRKTDAIRWSAAAVEICFSKPWHSTFFALGKTFPVIRGMGLSQPGMDFAASLLQHNQWLHLFPEGRVMRDDNQKMISNSERGYIFKWGAAKLILDYFRDPVSRDLDGKHAQGKRLRILPFYHLGLDEILPIGWPYIPRIGKQITIFFRPKVIELDSKLLNHILYNRQVVGPYCNTSECRTSEELDRIKMTNYLEEEVLRLSEPTTRLHRYDN